MSDTFEDCGLPGPCYLLKRQTSLVLILLLHIRLLLLVLLLLSPPLLRPDRLRRTILNQITLLINTAPLWQTVWDIDHSLTIEHMASATS